MATRTITRTIVTDDLTGQETTKELGKYEVSFMVKGAKASTRRTATVEMTEDSAAAFLLWVSELDPSQLATQLRSTARALNGSSDSEAAAIRVWAAASGIKVGNRGAISADLREKYRAAQVVANGGGSQNTGQAA